MTDKDPKPARRIPDERLFTVHFTTTMPVPISFEVHLQNVFTGSLMTCIRARFRLSPADAAIDRPANSKPGTVYAYNRVIAHFTITPPTLKGDPDEPT